MIFRLRGTKNIIPVFTVFFVPKTFKNWLTPPNWRLLGPVRITAIINNSSDSKRLSLDCFLFHIFFWDAGVVMHFCTDTLLQTDDVTHRSLYTEQLLYADTLTQRGLCTEKLLHTDAFTQRFSRKETFTHRSFCTPMLYTTMLLHSAAFTHRWLYYAFTHSRFHTHRSF